MGTDNQTAERVPPVDGEDPKPPVLQRASLTRTNLKRFDKIPSKQKRKKPTATATATASEATSSSTTSTETTTTKGSGAKLQANGVLLSYKDDSEGPLDLHHIQNSLKKESPAPGTLEDFKYYRRSIGIGHPETKTQSVFWSSLAKSCRQPEYDYNNFFNQAWDQLDNQLTVDISSAKPDIAEAFEAASFTAIADAADLPELFPAGTGTSSSFVMPSFAVEFKNANVEISGADLQCAYDGALMVHAAMKAHEYMYGSSEAAMASFWNKTKAITVAFNGKVLNIFAHYAAPNPKWKAGAHRVLFHQYALSETIVTTNLEAFKGGQQLTRNAQDLGFELNLDLRRQLLEHCEARVLADTRAALAAAESAKSAALHGPLSPLSNGPEGTTETGSDLGEPAAKKARIDA